MLGMTARMSERPHSASWWKKRRSPANAYPHLRQDQIKKLYSKIQEQIIKQKQLNMRELKKTYNVKLVLNSYKREMYI